jgi:hypothetical protein
MKAVRLAADRLFLLAAAALVILPAGACATARREPWVLTSRDLEKRPVRDLRRISTYPHALAATLDVMRNDLGLPAVQVELVFVPDGRNMSELLVRGGQPPEQARQAARELTAIGGQRVVLVNQARLERETWPGRVGILAHELGHVLQYELSGGKRETSAQWLREGFAEWLEMRVLEALKGDTREKAWSRALERVRNPAGPPVMTLGGPRSQAIERNAQVRLPSLRDLGSFPDWLAQLRGPAGGALYEYAFVAGATLVEDHGLPAVVRYFALFATSKDPAANFQAAFGQTERQFEARLRRVFWP